MTHHAKLDADKVRDYWLKWHDTSCEKLREEQPELIQTPEWFKHYPVTQAQHDEWYRWVIHELRKETKLPLKAVQRMFQFEYLNLAPSVK